VAGAAAGLLVVAGVVFALLQGGGDGGPGEPTSGAGAEPVMSDVKHPGEMDTGRLSAADWQNSVLELSTTDTVTVLDTHGTVEALDLVGTVKPWVEPKQEGARMVVTISADVLFDFDSAEVGEGGKAAILEAVKDAPDGATIDVTGYTDSLGTDEYNNGLSQRRADAVAAIIGSERPPLHVNPVGKGSADEVEPNTNADGTDNPEGRAKNRRVEIRYG
jgi:outer membrane protein OmpA-like peptidoglycan-associated protein